MPNQQYRMFELRLGGGYVLVASDDPQAIPWIVSEIRKQIQGCELKQFGDRWQRIQRLQNRDDEIGEWVKKRLLGAGWTEVDRKISRGRELGPIYVHYVLRRPVADTTATISKRVSDVGDQLEKLMNLHKSGAIDDAEFAAAKRKLLGM